jgi:hypothetical protein
MTVLARISRNLPNRQTLIYRQAHTQMHRYNTGRQAGRKKYTNTHIWTNTDTDLNTY